ncbi:hypothetical protein FB451DRAFT_1410494 [Mycena latifolia]|nr:hypothetical protein FB451DRAFT_1410494 [Mycena latifolia]
MITKGIVRRKDNQPAHSTPPPPPLLPAPAQHRQKEEQAEDTKGTDDAARVGGEGRGSRLTYSCALSGSRSGNEEGWVGRGGASQPEPRRIAATRTGLAGRDCTRKIRRRAGSPHREFLRIHDATLVTPVTIIPAPHSSSARANLNAHSIVCSHHRPLFCSCSTPPALMDDGTLTDRSPRDCHSHPAPPPLIEFS